MHFDEFMNSLDQPEPPSELPTLLKALWYDKNQDWDQAHKLAQAVPTNEGSWVHAYLHRVEGDLGNARYWYNRAGRTESQESLDEEWKEIVEYLIANAS